MNLRAGWFIWIVFLARFLAGREGLAADSLTLYCEETWVETGACPAHRCYLDCAGALQFEGCAQDCKPKPCFLIDVSNCPEDACDILEGCGETKRCYPVIRSGQGRCGNLAYHGQDVECCPGLTRRCGIEFFDGTCDMTGKNSVQGVPACLPCGNGICNQFENSCNCPEDCARPDLGPE
jgi:hypothetical protein